MPVINLYDELRAVIGALSNEGVDYALCGGLALAVHAEPRATKDIDLLVQPDDLLQVKAILRGLGYKLEAAPMEFSSGLRVQRVSKIVEHEVFTLDLVLVSDTLQEAWTTRQKVEWIDHQLWVVSREGLISMKRMSSRPQDLADVAALGADDGD